MIPGAVTTPDAMYPNRQYAIAFPVPDVVSLAGVTVKVTTAGHADSVIDCAIYADNFGQPGNLLVDLGDISSATTGVKRWAAPNKDLVGGRFYWITLTAHGTSMPETSRLSSTPWPPVVPPDGAGNPRADLYDALDVNFLYKDVPADPPAAIDRSTRFTQYAPFIGVDFTSPPLRFDPTLTDRVVALFPDESYEDDTCQESNVIWDGTQWNMIYSAGVPDEGIAWATGPSPLGPWTRHGFIVGQGAAGVARFAAHSSVLREAGTWYVYTSGRQVYSGASLGALTSAGTFMSDPGGGVFNTSVIKDGSTYRMLFDYIDGGTSQFFVGYATASSPTGPFTVQEAPLSTLRPGSGMYGGCDLHQVGSVYSVWYHATTEGTNLPCDIFHATSTDMETWTISNDGAPMIRREHRDEVDQCADPFAVTDPATSITYLFWSAMNNTTDPIQGVIMRNNPAVMPISLV